MQHMDDETRKEVLGEVLMDELKIIREYLEDVPFIKQKVTDIDQRLSVVESDMKVVKAAITDQSKRMDKCETRLTRLETARA